MLLLKTKSCSLISMLTHMMSGGCLRFSLKKRELIQHTQLKLATTRRLHQTVPTATLCPSALTNWLE